MSRNRGVYAEPAEATKTYVGDEDFVALLRRVYVDGSIVEDSPLDLTLGPPDVPILRMMAKAQPVDSNPEGLANAQSLEVLAQRIERLGPQRITEFE